MAGRVRVTFLIMAGGRGERLWPLVTAARPKVCVAPHGRQTLLGITLARLARVAPRAQRLIITSKEQVRSIEAVLPCRLHAAIIAEPEAKNTAACLALGAAMVAARDPSRILVAGPADHWIEDEPAFQRAVQTAIRTAARYDTLVTIGVRPTHAHAGLGYLCAGRRAGPGVYALRRFVEKPTPAVMRRLLAQHRVFWNGGYFIGRASVFVREIRAHLPVHGRRVIPAGDALARRHGIPRRAAASLARAYHGLTPVSFDHGVMEHLRGGLMVEGRFGWADLGSWDVWSQLGSRHQRTVLLESDNVAVISPPNHLVAAIGVKDLVIVHTPAATLVCHRSKAQAVRDVVRHLVGDPRLAAYR